MGIKTLMGAGIEVGIVTGRTSRALLHRCDNLGISLVFDQVRDKSGVLKVISKEKGVEAKHIAFVGDDLVDIPLMKKVGLSIAVADAHETVLEYADMVTSAQGGAGAVREVCEAILKAQGLWEEILARFL